MAPVRAPCHKLAPPPCSYYWLYKICRLGLGVTSNGKTFVTAFREIRPSGSGVYTGDRQAHKQHSHLINLISPIFRKGNMLKRRAESGCFKTNFLVFLSVRTLGWNTIPIDDLMVNTFWRQDRAPFSGYSAWCNPWPRAWEELRLSDITEYIVASF